MWTKTNIVFFCSLYRCVNGYNIRISNTQQDAYDKDLYTVGVLPERELSCFISDLCALEDWNHTVLHFLEHRDSRSYGHNHKKQGDLEQRAQR
jgi:hypothetical protein